MSGGHFEHNEFYLDLWADQLEQDIKYNDIPLKVKISENRNRF